jgi:hypothetical protein
MFLKRNVTVNMYRESVISLAVIKEIVEAPLTNFEYNLSGKEDNVINLKIGVFFWTF